MRLGLIMIMFLFIQLVLLFVGCEVVCSDSIKDSASYTISPCSHSGVCSSDDHANIEKTITEAERNALAGIQEFLAHDGELISQNSLWSYLMGLGIDPQLFVNTHQELLYDFGIDLRGNIVSQVELGDDVISVEYPSLCLSL